MAQRRTTKAAGRGRTTASKPLARRKATASKPLAKRTTTASKPVAKRKAAAVPLVSQYMTRSPHTIGRDQTLARAHELMNEYRIRHLPVLDGGQLVGMLSQRDLYFVETLDTTPASEIKVDEAMTQDVFEVAQDATLAQVADVMLRKKHGCAVVIDGSKVIGVFSTTDALRALLAYLPG
jgi:acetoin utilization protein AcuB